jgi:hypothetical protein
VTALIDCGGSRPNISSRCQNERGRGGGGQAVQYIVLDFQSHHGLGPRTVTPQGAKIQLNAPNMERSTHALKKNLWFFSGSARYFYVSIDL